MPDTSEKPDAAQPVIRFVDVCKSFGKLVVLDRVSVGFSRGDTTVIVGPSGVGKSVLLKHIVGLLHPDSGRVYFDDERIDTMSAKEMDATRRRIGYLFQLGALFDSMTVEENVCFPMHEQSDWSRSEKRDRCAAVLEMVGLSGIQQKMPADLSGGQRKRVALARAVALSPEVILYDEPTSGLDPVRSDTINELILKLQSELSVTSLVVTHDMNSAFKVGDRILMLYDSQIVADGDPEAFREDEHEAVQAFIEGRSEADVDDQLIAEMDGQA